MPWDSIKLNDGALVLILTSGAAAYIRGHMYRHSDSEYRVWDVDFGERPECDRPSGPSYFARLQSCW